MSESGVRSFFFFQAEDGIRDHCVTGVQTCALPIWLSGGQRRRLDVALGLVGDPELVFLDEPTTGFDPVSRRAAWRVVRDLRALGKTVVLTTHYLDEAEHLADRVGVIVGGRLVEVGTP